MRFVDLHRDYDAWPRTQMPVWDDDVARKHERMREGAFPFLRATFFRFAERFAALCPELHDAPVVIAVGDVHVENFGTWRDAEGRLAWGLNDFDEAAPMPYVVDIVRLAASAVLAFAGDGHDLKAETVLDHFLASYTQTLEVGGEPFVLGERHRWLRDLAESELRDSALFWAKLDRAKPLEGPPPREVTEVIHAAAPEKGLAFRYARRIAGLGSLGRPRYLGTATWRGARIAREAKRLCPSAWRFAGPTLQGKDDEALHAAILAATAIRAPDPTLAFHGAWVVRRLSPHCSKIELADLPTKHDRLRLLAAMGHELANVHLGTAGAASRLLGDLGTKRRRALTAGAERLAASTHDDFRAHVNAAR